MQAVIFDMDGTLIDNKQYHHAAWKVFCSVHAKGRTFDYDYIMETFFGKTNDVIMKFLFGENISPEQIKYYADEKEQIYRNLIEKEILPIKGLFTYLNFLKEKGVKCAIGSSAPRANINFVVDKLNLKDYINTIACDDDVENGKPAPDIFLLAAERLNVSSENCIVFEDSKAGIQAGVAAGMRTIGITTQHTKQELLVMGAHEAFMNFEEYLNKQQ